MCKSNLPALAGETPTLGRFNKKSFRFLLHHLATMMSCRLHSSQMGKLTPPSAFAKIYKEECTLCFVTVDAEDGLDVCLTCFNGACTGPATKQHSTRHYRKTGHALVVNIKRTRRASEAPEDEGVNQPAKVIKVEVVADREPEYDFESVIRCLACSSTWPHDSGELEEGVRSTVKAIMANVSAQKRIEVQTWQEEEIPCDHTRRLEQHVTSQIHRLQARDQCSECELRENLWMCLVCGAIGCGRRQFDGSGGNGHGASHYEATKHAAAVKLGTITPDGAADVHCYVCNEMRVDPALVQHLSVLGLDLAGVERTEKTMAELQLEQNVKFDFSMVTEDGKQLQPVHGPGLTGLCNLGNSCYMSSVIQSLFLLPMFREAYAGMAGETHVAQCQRDSAACFACQASKLTSDLWSGTLEKISPWMFRAVATLGHPEFSTAKQQDASEFLSYLFKVIQRSDPDNAKSLVSPFSFTLQQSIRCLGCGDTRHQQISNSTQLALQISDVLSSSGDDVTVADKLPLTRFIERAFSPEIVDARCSKCGGGEKQRKVELTSLPEYLVVSLSRYVLRNWVPQKIDMAVQVPFFDLDLGEYVGEAVAPVKEERPRPEIDESVVDELASMGFPLSKCRRAVAETGNQGLEAAMNWILENEDLVVPEETADSPAPEEVSSEMVQLLVEAGFSATRARHALEATNGDVERAFDWILSHPDHQSNEEDEPENSPSVATKPMAAGTTTKYDLVAFISHKGPSVHCGHYIAHAVHADLQQWIMFNDERVVIADPQPPTAAEQAYVYIYKRQSH